jgi:drug/metabolite transporter (DMT)-like permease
MEMILGTPRRWWIAAGVVFLAGLILLATGIGGTLGTVGGVVFIIAAMILFAAAPMRYGQSAQKPANESATPTAPIMLEAPEPQPRAEIEARDATEV